MPIVTIHVTQEDIASGERSHCRNCPVALAIGRVVPQYVVMVSSTVRFYTDYNTNMIVMRSLLPPEVFSLVADYDINGRMAPFQFELAVPET